MIVIWPLSLSFSLSLSLSLSLSVGVYLFHSHVMFRILCDVSELAGHSALGSQVCYTKP